MGQVLVLFGLSGALVFTDLARGRRHLDQDGLSRPKRARFGFEIAGRLFYKLAITLIPLSTATVILQTMPLVVLADAALIGALASWALIALSGLMIIRCG